MRVGHVSWGSSGQMPALLMRMERWGMDVEREVTAAAMEESEVTSSWTRLRLPGGLVDEMDARTVSPFWRSRAPIMMWLLGEA